MPPDHRRPAPIQVQPGASVYWPATSGRAGNKMGNHATTGDAVAPIPATAVTGAKRECRHQPHCQAVDERFTIDRH